MNYEPFLERCKIKFPKEECMTAIIERFEDVFSDENFSDNARACELFYINNKVSKAQFFRMKKYVKEFYDWLFEQGLISSAQTDYVSSLTLDDVISNEEIRDCYFRDLDEALDFVCAVGRDSGLDDDDDLLMIKTIVILSWYGLDRLEMTEIKKGDLVMSKDEIRINDNYSIKLEHKYFDIIYRFSILDIHRGFPSGKKQVYEYSTYLMRATKSTKMNRNQISQAIKRFNVVSIDRFGHKLSTCALQNNGAFYQMLHNDNQDSRGLTIAVENIVGCDRHAAFWYKIMYEKWKNIYYPKGGGSL